ncbi:MAG: sulfotransferase [Hyphomonadaceae bacterium]|nr:sulfotransferase [Hyphomonadaceae bacterium]
MSRAGALEKLRHDLLAGPNLVPHNLNLSANNILLIRLSDEALQTASFLDERVVSPETPGIWVSVNTLREALTPPPIVPPLRYIFHIGHVGSTLLSRLLGEIRGVAALREPFVLRRLAEAHDALNTPLSLYDQPVFASLTRDLLTLLGRCSADKRAVVIKPTSAVGRMADWLMAHAPQSRCVYLHLDAEPFLAAVLAGKNSIVDLRGHAQERLRRLLRLRPHQPVAPLYALSSGELAAQAWLTETLTMRQLAKRLPDKTSLVSFDDLLASPALVLAAICAHLELAVAPGEIDAVLAGPTLTRYAKAPAHEYSPALRTQYLRESRQRNAEEIARGLLWIDRMREQGINLEA